MPSRLDDLRSECASFSPTASIVWARLYKCLFPLLLSLCFFSSGCQSRARRPSSSSALTPLAAPSWLAKLEVPGFGESRVALPLGATRARPVVIALHGDADRPEWPCGSYRDVVRDRAFVLCPRGVPVNGGRFGLGSVQQTREELRAALAKLKGHYGAHVAHGAVVLAALGPAVDQALALALEEPSFFAYLVLLDGSGERFSAPRMKRFAEGGGRRVLFICTRLGCDSDRAQGGSSELSSTTGRVLALRSMGVDARVESVPSAVGLDGHATATLKKHWAWLVADDPRWKK